MDDVNSGGGGVGSSDAAAQQGPHGRRENPDSRSKIAAPEREPRSGGPGKLCSRCRIRKSFGDFNRDRDSADGRQGYCRECSRSAAAAWYAAHRDAKVASTRRWKLEHPDETRRMRRQDSRRRRAGR